MINPYVWAGLNIHRNNKFTPLTVDRIVKKTINNLNITQEQLEGSSRKREVVECRMIIAKLIVDEKLMSYKRVGEIFNRDHTTIVHYMKATDNLMNDKLFAEKFNFVKSKL